MDFLNNFMFGGGNNNNNNNRQNPPNPSTPPNPGPTRPGLGLGRGGGGGGGGQRPAHPSTRGGLPQILDMLRVYPSYTVDRPDLENGNKVLLPARILEQMTNEGNLPHPMIFAISTLRNHKTVYVGVLEFLAPDDWIVMPFWLFTELKLNEGEMVRLGLVDFLPKATYAKLRPHKTDFIDLPDPRAILEFHLRDFVCFTKGETISLKFMDQAYQLDVLELKPENQYNSAILIDTDLNIDFAPPLDYVEPVRKDSKRPGEAADPKAEAANRGMRVDSRPLDEAQVQSLAEPEFDPRKFVIPHGIRREWFKPKFTGTGTKIGG